MDGKELLKMDLVKQEMRRACEYGQACWGQRFVEAMETLLPTKRFESPLEAAFWMWWHVFCERHGADRWIDLIQQQTVVAKEQNYRLDFVVRPFDWDDFYPRLQAAGLPVPRIGVELDGHDFHERTKEQVAKRNARDRHLLSEGWLIFHYSGSEFVKDPRECVEQVVNEALTANLASWKKLRAFEKGNKA